VSSVADDRHNNLIFLREPFHLALLGRVHSDLESSGKCCVFLSASHVTVLQTWPHRVNIEEGVLSVLDIGDRVAVERLVSGVAHSCQVHVCTFFLSLDALKLGVVEVGGIIQVFLLGRAVGGGFQHAEVVCVEFFHVGGGKPFDCRGSDAFAVLSIDSGAGRFSKRLSVQVFRLNLRDLSGIAGNVLRLHVSVGAAQPVVSVLGEVSVLQRVIELVGIWRFRVEFTLGK